MRSPRMFVLAALLCALPVALLPPRLWGQATTNPVGYVTIPLLANSDTLISIPFTQPAAFTGAVSGISGSTITVASLPGGASNVYTYTANVQSNTYYVSVGPNLTTLTGTVSVTNGSAVVTGTGTNFTNPTQIAVNDELLVGGLAYNVLSIAIGHVARSLARVRGHSGCGTDGHLQSQPERRLLLHGDGDHGEFHHCESERRFAEHRRGRDLDIAHPVLDARHGVSGQRGWRLVYRLGER